MKKTTLTIIAALLVAGCTTETEFEISSEDVPQAVATAFGAKFPGASEVEWEVEKGEDDRLYFEAEFKLEGEEQEASFRPDGTFAEEAGD